MLTEEKSSENVSYRAETSDSKLSKPDSGQNGENPVEKIGICGNGFDSLRESREGCQSKLSYSVQSSGEKIGFSDKQVEYLRKSVIDPESGSQELTFSYLCDNLKSGDNNRLKGKGAVLEDLSKEEGKWVERDFLQLNDCDGGTSKREAEEDNNRGRDFCKKPKLETQTLNLSLALPDISLSLSASNPAPSNCDAAVQPKPSRSMHSLAISKNNTLATCSDDFTAASLSYSYSHQFSHNPSCSLTRNSTEYYENSVGSRRRETDQIWSCGEGTNGSVHSRFKPIGDGVALSNHGNGVVSTLLNSRSLNRDACYSLYRAAASDSSSFFPSELPAKPRTDLCSVDTMSKSLDQLKGLDSLEDMRGHKLSRGERIVRDFITEPVPVILQLSRDLPVESIEAAREYLTCLMAAPERKDELVYLQRLLESRSDVTKETLSKSDRVQMEILVAVKFGLSEFVSGKLHLSTSILVEIFLYMRCRNVNCNSSLPVDDCDCKICSTKKGFCSQCMCPVCYNYDCASNTCSWVGCDACSHWCHAACGTEKYLIRPGPSLKGSSATTEMQFYCVGCGHASEMFGFVKDVFICCAKDWGLETLIKELDCVRKIFKGSENLKGKELYLKAAELITRLERRAISPSDACSVIIHFFASKPEKEDMAEYAAAGIGAKDHPTASQGRRLDDVFPPFINLPPKSGLFDSGTMLQGLVSYDNFRYCSPKPHLSSDQCLENELLGKFSKNDTFEFHSSESIIRLKEEEARMLQNRADEARKEVEAYQQLVQEKTEKLKQEYTEKLAKLCLLETEERRRRKLEELRMLENSHSDYFKMKIRMQAEIRGLIERMEAMKQLWV